MKKLLCLSSILILLSFSAYAQEKKTTNRPPDIRLVKNKPSIFISYERSGKRQPLKNGESQKGVWLRLHNNTKWQIIFPAFGVPVEFGDVGMFYEIETEGKSTAGDSNEIPKGYELDEVYSTIRLGPGKSVLFSIPYEHLIKGLKLRIRFSYEWENQNDVFADREPLHFVYFRSSVIPESKNN